MFNLVRKLILVIHVLQNVQLVMDQELITVLAAKMVIYIPKKKEYVYQKIKSVN